MHEEISTKVVITVIKVSANIEATPIYLSKVILSKFRFVKVWFDVQERPLQERSEVGPGSFVVESAGYEGSPSIELDGTWELVKKARPVRVDSVARAPASGALIRCEVVCGADDAS